MSDRIEQASARLYGKLWDFIARWMRVPAKPPSLPVEPGEDAESFKPAPGFLRYLKFWFWLALFPVDGLILIGWIVLGVCLVFVIGVALPLVSRRGADKTSLPPAKETLRDWRNEK